MASSRHKAGRAPAGDMIAVPLGPDQRLVVVASRYFQDPRNNRSIRRLELMNVSADVWRRLYIRGSLTPEGKSWRSMSREGFHWTSTGFMQEAAGCGSRIGHMFGLASRLRHPSRPAYSTLDE